MKIVQLCPYAMDRPGGVQRHVRDLSRWLGAAGHETRILCPPAPRAARRKNETVADPRKTEGRAGAPGTETIADPRQSDIGATPPDTGIGAVGHAPGTDEDQEGADEILLELGRSWTLALHGTAFEISRAPRRDVRAMAACLRDWGADLVHMHTPWTPLLTAQMFRALRLPTVTTVHATLPDPSAGGPVNRYVRWSARRLVPASDAVIVPSKAPLPLLQAVCPGVSARILPPTVNLAPWTRAARAKAPGAAPLSLLFLGRLEPRKGLDIALAAWSAISAALPKARLTLAGDGPLRDMALAARSDRVTLVGRPDDAAVRRLMAEADLFLAPAPYGESFGLILTEALAAGALPVAAANAGYASVLTGPGATLLVPPGDAQALAQRVIDLAPPETRAPLASWARDRARHFDVATQGPLYLDLYETVLARRTG